MQKQGIDEYGDEYGDEGIKSLDAKVPKFLIWTYAILPIWGLITLWWFWNGSLGWFDRGSWRQLQIAANTTFPSVNEDDPSANKDQKVHDRAE